MELALVKVRWLLVAYGVVQTLVERAELNPPPHAFAIGVVLTIGLA